MTAKGALLLLEGERCPGLFVVKSGSVKLYRNSSGGEEQIVRLARHGDCFECVPFFDGGVNPVTAEALQDCSLYFLPAGTFQSALENYPEVALAFAPILARRLRAMVHTVGDYSARRVYPRLAKLLCQMSGPKGDLMLVSPSSPLSQHQLACMLGCSRQVVNTSLQRLAREGIIKIERQRIIVLDVEALRSVV